MSLLNKSPHKDLDIDILDFKTSNLKKSTLIKKGVG